MNEFTYAGKKFATTGHSRLEIGFIFRSQFSDELLLGKSSASCSGACLVASSIFDDMSVHRSLEMLRYG